MHSIYELDFLHRQRAGNTEHAVSRYWNQHAKRELRDLNNISADEITAEQLDKKHKLQAALGGLLELEDQLGSTPPSPLRDKLSEELLALYNSEGIARSVFETMGVERCRDIAINRSRKSFNWQLAKNGNAWRSVGSYLTNESFLALLNLTESQKRMIKSESSRMAKEREKFAKKKIEDQKKVSDKRWAELLDTLTPEQRSKVKKIIGRPVEWFRIPKNNTFEKSGATWLPVATIFNGAKSMKVSGALQMTADELKAHDIELVDSLVYRMLYATALWPELELVESQEDDLTGRLRSSFNKSGLVKPEAKRLESLLEGKANYGKSVNDLLLPSQIEWFQQIELQIRLEKKYDPFVGLLNSKVIGLLRLNSDQQSSIKSIGERYRKDEEKWQDELQSKNKATLDAFEVEVTKILTEEQRKIYKKFTG